MAHLLLFLSVSSVFFYAHICPWVLKNIYVPLSNEDRQLNPPWKTIYSIINVISIYICALKLNIKTKCFCKEKHRKEEGSRQKEGEWKGGTQERRNDLQMNDSHSYMKITNKRNGRRQHHVFWVACHTQKPFVGFFVVVARKLSLVFCCEIFAFSSDRLMVEFY